MGCRLFLRVPQGHHDDYYYVWTECWSSTSMYVAYHRATSMLFPDAVLEARHYNGILLWQTRFGVTGVQESEVSICSCVVHNSFRSALTPCETVWDGSCICSTWSLLTNVFADVVVGLLARILSRLFISGHIVWRLLLMAP